MTSQKKSTGPSEKLFAEPQAHMFEKFYEERIKEGQHPVECLGMTFPDDKTRRQYFLEKLREKLKDPKFRKIEGFPIGSDEDILALSDPPYYTACPNPFIEDFIKHYGKSYDPATDTYRREPFAADVSEGKNDPIYNAHSYHTKVPHKAIMRYILHYTEPGDIVFDGFCGTGMTGVAAQMCADRAAIEELNLRVQKDGVVSDSGNSQIGKIGLRYSILCDLSPIASFVAARYNDFQPPTFSSSAMTKIIETLKSEFGDYYDTTAPDSGFPGIAQFYVWSEVFACPHCAFSAPLYVFAVDIATYKLKSDFSCPSCNAQLTKENLDRVWTTSIDPTNNKPRKEARCELVEVSARIKNRTQRFAPTKYDHEKLEKIVRKGLAWVPSDEFPHGRQTRKVKSGSGISTISQMFTPRSLAIISQAWELILKDDIGKRRFNGLFLLSSVLTLLSRRERYRDGTGKGAQSGTLYVPSLQIEKNAFDVIERKRKSFETLGLNTFAGHSIVTCQSHADLFNIQDNSVDYIFTDPPFGESLQYAELNFFHEAWLRVYTQLKQDCVLNYVHGKDLPFYQALMIGAFTQAYRILKPGRWITVEFHNSQNSVWMAIQEALWRAGFTVADVRILDKKQGTFNVVNRAGAVKQDLVISAYKPNGGLEERFKLTAGAEEGVWDFIRAHLKQLPVFVTKDGRAEVIAERQNYLLFDRMVAFHVQRGVTVPLSAAEFYQGLAQRFPERDGMYFLPEQVAEYDKKRLTVKEIMQLELFVIDESSAIQWLRQQLLAKPQTFQDLHPQFLKEIGGWQKHEKPLELSELLADNFLRYEGQGEVPGQIHSYLSSNFKELRNLPKDDPALRAKAKDRWYVPDPNKATDLEKLRERRLLKEFQEYRESPQKKLKVFRLEAVRAGFKKAWQERDYSTIIEVARKIPETILHEDPKLLMYYDQALTRMEAKG
ncbi:MAG: DNA methyltransferase [Deltaproteobacteria bacterium]|nr:DNA methyltransferase [Deltaproteobacteria bacterium]